MTYNLTAWNGTKDTPLGELSRGSRVLALVSDGQVDAGTDARVQQDDKSSAQRRNEEEQLGAMGLLLGEVGADAADEVQHDERAEANGRIEVGVGKPLECVDDDLVRRLAGLDVGNSHELGDLANGDVDGGARHEGADGGQGDEFDEPAESRQTEEDDDGAGDDGERRSDNMALDLGELVLGLENDVTRYLGHDGHGLGELSAGGAGDGSFGDGLTPMVISLDVAKNQ